MSAAHAHVRRTASAPGLRATSPSSSHALRLGFLGDTPHITGAADCRCSGCHLKVQVFPRRQDGRIVLPHPSVPSGIRKPGEPPRTGTRERIGSIQRPRRIDLGEGTSDSYSRLSGPGVPAGPHNPIQIIHIAPHPDDLGHPREIVLVESHASRPKRSKPRKKPYQPPGKRPEPWPRFSNASTTQPQPRSRSQSASFASGPRSGFETSWAVEPSRPTGSDLHLSNPYAEINSNPTVSKTGGRLAWPDPYATIVEEPFSQLFTSPIALGKRQLNLSGSSTTLSHRTSSSRESGEKTPQVATSSSQQPTSAYLSERNGSESPHEHEQHGEATFSQTNRAGVMTSNNVNSPRDLTGVPAEDPPMLFRFNSCPNPLPAMWISRADGEDRPQLVITPQQSQTGMLRFENSLIPDSQPASMTESTRDNSAVQVKWDTERKRRQGYFAQEQGVEKSPFRHYNKTSCGFDNP